MKHSLWAVVFIFLSFIGRAQSWQKTYAEAEDAYVKKDYSLFYSKLKEANKIHPYHQGLLYKLGIASALTNHTEEAFIYLRKAILINADFKLEDENDLASLLKRDEWPSLIELQKKWKQPIIQSKQSIVLTDRQLHAEGIDYDPNTKTFYMGSIHKRKIVKINDKGEATDFCPSAFNGMTSIFGIKIDQKRNVLWACSSPMPEMENYDSVNKSTVFKFALNSGNLISKFEIPTAYKNSIFGDLILDSSGNPFISDSKNNIVWTLDSHDNYLVEFYSSPEFWNIQGLAFNETGTELFVTDYIKGIFKLETTKKELTAVLTKKEVSLKGIDGIYFYQSSLIAIQNGVNPLRVTRYFLNDANNEILDYKIMDNNHPDFNEPTLGVITGSDFYYIANSQWGGYVDGKIKPVEMLKDIVVLRHQFH